jgi:hypothetical protein
MWNTVHILFQFAVQHGPCPESKSDSEQQQDWEQAS